MKKSFFAFLFTSVSLIPAFSQNSPTINNANYYNYHVNEGSTNWLRMNDAVPIIIDELIKNGIFYHEISVGELIKINDSTRLVVTVGFEKEDKEYGFLYEATHSIPLSVKHRDFLSDPKKATFLQVEKDLNNDVDFMMVKSIPSNFFVLKQTCYWYQPNGDTSKFPVSKDVISEVLRQDIRAYLKKIK